MRKMQNYEIIRDYIKTFPKEMSIGEVIDNIEKAEKLHQENLEKQKARMEENIGKCYYYDNIDEDVRIVRCFYRIDTVKINKTPTGDICYYICDMIEQSDDTIYVMPNVSITERDIVNVKEISEEDFNKVKSFLTQFKQFEPQID